MKKNVNILFSETKLVNGLYRPFIKQWLYFDKDLNERQYQMPNIFPESNIHNIIIAVTGIGGKKGFPPSYLTLSLI